MGFVTAFLNSQIGLNLYVKAPLGYESTDERIWKLKSSLNGLKHTTFLWNKHFERNKIYKAFCFIWDLVQRER